MLWEKVIALMEFVDCEVIMSFAGMYIANLEKMRVLE